MTSFLEKSVTSGRKVTIIYVSTSGIISKRVISILSLYDEHIVAYCCLRKQTRRFRIQNILAIEE